LNADEFITTAVRGIVIDSDLAQLTRWIFLVSEAEVDCDKDGIDSFVDRYGARGLTDLGCVYERIGAAKLAAIARPIADAIPSANEVDLDRMNELVRARAGYDYGSIRALIEGQMMGKI
jgi:hypothetical protein